MEAIIIIYSICKFVTSAMGIGSIKLKTKIQLQETGIIIKQVSIAHDAVILETKTRNTDYDKP